MKPLIFVALLSLCPLSAQAQTLAEDAHITEKLVAAQAGDILRKACPKVGTRMLVVFSEMMALKSYAKSQGHDDAEIKAFLKNKAQKKRIRTLAEDYLAKAGFVAGDEANACATARAEVDKATTTGSLIWVSNW